jgi:hypothetical protein
VFVDECGTHTSMTRRYARAPKGKRAYGHVPRNRGPKHHALGEHVALGDGRGDGAVEGATTKAVFEAYVEQVLAPTLIPGQVVILDNLTAHKSKRVLELVEGRGCRVLFLPASTRRTSRPMRRRSPRSKRCSRRMRPGPARRSSKASGGHFR